MDSKEAILRQIDDVLANTQEAGPSKLGMMTRLVATIERVAPGTAYEREAHEYKGYDYNDYLRNYTGLLQQVRVDIEAGYLHTTITGLIHAEVFADFLEMADELQTKGFKDPAAVVAGSVLEEHLRKLAQRNDISIEDDEGKPLKASRINADLARADVYNKLDQQNVTAWLALRNSAAHGKYDECDHKQVAALISSVRDFLIRHTA